MSDYHHYRFLRYAPRDGTTMQMQPGRWTRMHLDPWLLGLLFIATVFGLVVLYSASGQDVSMVTRQAISFSMAFVVMITLAQVPPKMYQAFSPWFFGIGLILLIMVALVGQVSLGARRWLGFGGIRFQPSEFLKLAMPMMMAWYLSNRTLPPNWRVVLTALMIIVVPAALIAKQPDLGTALLVSASGFFVLFLAGLPWWMIGSFIAALGAILPIAWEFLLHDYQKQRVLTLIDPKADALGTGWNIIQSKTAIGSGGFMGKGYLHGTQSHLQFLPEGHTDFIIAAFSEEFGLIGVCLLLLLYSALVGRALFIAFQTNNTYGRLLAGAIGMSFFVYVFVNVGMVSGILPVVGVPLPFISYGGTALITLMSGFGLLMSIRTHR
ncbi:MAG: rod shape-determining protein RodA [Gammaproteobacteria bacterium]|nr:rod shape-determining protein RodA [Gammaproteobacteria bacterium]